MEDSLTESRGQKRSEMAEGLPADKRACSSLEFRPSSSTVTPETLDNSTNLAVDAHGGDMETSSSSASASGHSEGDGERDSPYGSCDSDDMFEGDHMYSSLRALQRSRSYNNSAKFDRLVSSLNNDAEPSGQLAALNELCELLSFSTSDSISSSIADQLSSALVKLAKHENNPDIMLLAIRALTYSCDVFPRSSGSLVRHDAVPALCQRLLVIEYLDVAEQCLQALEKISRDHPLACLQSGSIIAVLGYIDFFSTTVQRTALRTVVNICKELPSECPSTVIEAVPRLCALLQYEDQQLVELVATCFIKIADCVKDSPLMLSELYDHGLINQVTRLLELNNRITLSQSTYTGLIGLVAKVASGSPDAVRTLFELNIGGILKDGLSNSDISNGTPHRLVDSNHTQVLEILKLLHKLLPEVPKDKKEELLSSTERILLDHPDNLEKFGIDILSTLMQVFSSGANLYVCYGCLSVINRLVYFSKPETLLKLFEGINIASFLAGVFTQNDHHVLVLALQISETVLEKISNILMQAFVKEGVLFAIDNLLMPDSSCSQPSFPMVSSSQYNKIAGKEVMGCLCYAYHTRELKSTSDSEPCKVNKDSVYRLAEQVKRKFFAAELHGSQSMVTDLLQDLRNASLAMNDLLTLSPAKGVSGRTEERLCSILDKIILQLGGNVSVSTFELVESGIMKALLNYLSNGHFLSSSYDPHDPTHAYGVQKRFEAFARISLSLPDSASIDLPLSFLVRKLHSALSNVENFPVVAGFATKQRGSYATVPSGRPTMYQCLKVRFLRGEEELCLDDYVKDVVTVEPFCLVEEIEQYLRPKVAQTKMRSSETHNQAFLEEKPKADQDHLDTSSLLGKSVEHHGSGITCNVSPDMQEDGDGKSLCSAMETSNLGQKTFAGTRVTSDVQYKSREDKVHSLEGTENMIEASSTCVYADGGNSTKGQSKAPLYKEETPSKLALYLDGEQLEYSSTLYQEILQRKLKSHHELQNGSKLWSSTYIVTYRRVAGKETSSLKECREMHDSGTTDGTFLCRQVMPLFSSIFVDRFGSTLSSSSSISDILLLLKSLEMMNRFSYHLVSYERMKNFAEGRLNNLDELKVALPTLSQYDFVNNRLTEKLEQQMRDPSAVHVSAMPLWWCQLIAKFPFLFGFEARCKFFQLAAFGRLHTSSISDSNMSRDRRASTGSPLRKKFLVCRERILESAGQMMELYANKKAVVEVEYGDEVGTGLGPTLEFYTSVSHEFQKVGLGMWRGDYMSFTNSCNQQGSHSGFVVSTSGLFPRPWSSTSTNINGIEFSDVIKKFILLGQIVGKALQDGRVLDIPFSIAFYKLILGKELSFCDIQSFDPELGRTLLEFKALVSRQKCSALACNKSNVHGDSSMFRSTKFDDLCLEFTLPGYPDYTLSSGMEDVMVNINNLEEYISLVLDATLQTGVSKQVEAFKSGLNQVISDKHLQIFTEEELERLLCGERDSWVSGDLFDNIKFDHGYTAGSPAVINLMEVINEFSYDLRRAFLQFVTGAPRLPPGGLAALNPKLTIVCKHSSNCADADLPSVMTCANYLKLPPYSSKEIMKEKLLYAITEGQGSFHLS